METSASVVNNLITSDYIPSKTKILDFHSCIMQRLMKVKTCHRDMALWQLCKQWQLSYIRKHRCHMQQHFCVIMLSGENTRAFQTAQLGNHGTFFKVLCSLFELLNTTRPLCITKWSINFRVVLTLTEFQQWFSTHEFLFEKQQGQLLP